MQRNYTCSFPLSEHLSHHIMNNTVCGVSVLTKVQSVMTDGCEAGGDGRELPFTHLNLPLDLPQTTVCASTTCFLVLRPRPGFSHRAVYAGDEGKEESEVRVFTSPAPSQCSRPGWLDPSTEGHTCITDPRSRLPPS